MKHDRRLRLRHGSIRITPTEFGPLAGFNARQDRPADRVLDDLEAAMVWIADGGPGTVWLSLDIVAVPAWLTDRIKITLGTALDLDPELIMVCASHTHSAPMGWVGTIHPGNPGTVDDAMLAELLITVGELGRQVAQQPWVPVVAEFRQPLITGGGTNRHRPDGPHQSHAGVLSLIGTGAEDRGSLALVVDYACHPTVLGADSFGWSADWPGAMRKRLRKRMERSGANNGPTVVFLQGAAGDASTRFVRREQTAAELTRIGELIADQVLPNETPGSSGPAKVTKRCETIMVRHRELPSADRVDADLADARQALRQLTDASVGDRRIAETRVDGAEVQRDLVRADLPATVAIKITIIVLGDIAWVHLPVEPFSTIADRIRSRSPYGSTRVIGYTDDYLGYLPDDDAIADRQYEAFSSLFDTAGARTIIDAAGRLLNSTSE